MKDLVLTTGLGTSIGLQTPPKVSNPHLGSDSVDGLARQSAGECYCDVALHVHVI